MPPGRKYIRNTVVHYLWKNERSFWVVLVLSLTPVPTFPSNIDTSSYSITAPPIRLAATWPPPPPAWHWSQPASVRADRGAHPPTGRRPGHSGRHRAARC